MSIKNFFMGCFVMLVPIITSMTFIFEIYKVDTRASLQKALDTTQDYKYARHIR